jgi:excisionase family DNA binding protein
MGDHGQQELHAFTTRSAASRLDKSPEAVRYLIRTGQIKAARIGRQYFVPADEITRLLKTDHSTEGVPATGKQVTMTGMSIHRFAGDKIHESWDYYDALGLMQQLGAILQMAQGGA